MILYGSSPDVLASSQRYYDQLYGAANAANASAANEAAYRNMQAMLAAQSADDRAREFDIGQQQDSQRMAMTARENQLNRDAALEGEKLRFKATQQTRSDDRSNRRYIKAQTQAQNGLLPYYAADIQSQYGVTPDEATALAATNANALQGKFQSELTRQFKMTGSVSPDLVGNYFPTGSADYAKAMGFFQTMTKPLQKQFDDAQTNADRGNFARRIVQDVAGINANPNPPTTNGQFSMLWDAMKSSFNPFRSVSGVPQANIIQPQGDWQTRAANIVASLQNPKGNNSGVLFNEANQRFEPASVAPVLPAGGGNQPAPPAFAPPTFTGTSYPQFNSPEEVGRAYNQGLIDRQTAISILQNDFGQD